VAEGAVMVAEEEGVEVDAETPSVVCVVRILKL